METAVPIFIGIVFVIIVAVILFNAGKGLYTWSKNNGSPLQTEPVKVVAKRQQFEDGVGNAPGTTRHFITFEHVSRERRELEVKAKHYGLIAEGDQGTLTYQGSRFLGFERM